MGNICEWGAGRFVLELAFSFGLFRWSLVVNRDYSHFLNVNECDGSHILMKVMTISDGEVEVGTRRWNTIRPTHLACHDLGVHPAGVMRTPRVLPLGLCNNAAKSQCEASIENIRWNLRSPFAFISFIPIASMATRNGWSGCGRQKASAKTIDAK